ncbi:MULTISPECIES: hypothetical protein [unclassified Mesorhizobium]|nr:MULTISPECIES: hypothetical protein [unclassified Mesorhizobium]
MSRHDRVVVADGWMTTGIPTEMLARYRKHAQSDGAKPDGG